MEETIRIEFCHLECGSIYHWVWHHTMKYYSCFRYIHKHAFYLLVYLLDSWKISLSVEQNTVRHNVTLMFIQVLSLYHVGICYICFDNLLCLINLHAATQFRILQYRLLYLGETIEKQPNEYAIKETLPSNYLKNYHTVFKCCVREHQDRINYCQRLNNIFTYIVLGHIVVFSLLLCLVGFQVLMVSTFHYDKKHK